MPRGFSTTGPITVRKRSDKSLVTLVTEEGVITGAVNSEVDDSTFVINNHAAPTKQVAVSAAGVTAGQKRVLTAPNYNATLASLAGVETLTNKTLTKPVIDAIADGAIDRLTIAAPKALTDAATSLFEIALGAGKMCGGLIIATIEASDGTDHQAFTEVVTFSAVNKAGVYTKDVDVVAAGSKAASGGTLTTAWAFLDGVNKVTMQLTPTGSLTETTYRVTYVVICNCPNAITIL